MATAEKNKKKERDDDDDRATKQKNRSDSPVLQHVPIYTLLFRFIPYPSLSTTSIILLHDESVSSNDESSTAAAIRSSWPSDRGHPCASQCDGMTMPLVMMTTTTRTTTTTLCCLLLPLQRGLGFSSNSNSNSNVVSHLHPAVARALPTYLTQLLKTPVIVLPRHPNPLRSCDRPLIRPSLRRRTYLRAGHLLPPLPATASLSRPRPRRPTPPVFRSPAPRTLRDDLMSTVILRFRLLPRCICMVVVVASRRIL